MFFKRKSPILEENVAKQGIKKMDRVVTGVLLGGIIASIYGVNKLRHKNDVIPGKKEEVEGNHEKKQSILSRIFFGNK